MDSHEKSVIWQKCDAILNLVIFSKQVGHIPLYVMLVRLEYYIQLWALHFQTGAGSITMLSSMHLISSDLGS